MSLWNFWIIERPDVKNESAKIHLRTKSVRSASGVLVVTVLTSPFPEFTKEGQRVRQSFSCKQNCAYCPDEPEVQLQLTITKMEFRDDMMDF
eukprot:CAMPEP_0116900672 /NCGR_PEP_ID=MMETSP0467-20121206/8851_1 /TAXON_ID=283647 /ORGANISM="Mesodinium pulex, Strain SPMC105" /LENGTH=91 /DNA_ID=CAMNT_0004573947 /DNA_START=117 /DNA_END=392 /DNA_ORIENTATION=+